MQPEEIERLRKEDPEVQFDEWWYSIGYLLDPEPSVEWLHKRKELCGYVWMASRTALPACLDEIERLHTFVAEWSERFGFLAENHARDSIDSIDEVACILNAKQAELVKANKVDLRTTLAFEAWQRDAEARIKELEERLAKAEAVVVAGERVVNNPVWAGICDEDVDLERAIEHLRSSKKEGEC